MDKWQASAETGFKNHMTQPLSDEMFWLWFELQTRAGYTICYSDLEPEVDDGPYAKGRLDVATVRFKNEQKPFIVVRCVNKTNCSADEHTNLHRAMEENGGYPYGFLVMDKIVTAYSRLPGEQNSRIEKVCKYRVDDGINDLLDYMESLLTDKQQEMLDSVFSRRYCPYDAIYPGHDCDKPNFIHNLKAITIKDYCRHSYPKQ